MAPRRGTGFLNWDELLELNRPAADQMAQRVTGALAREGREATSALDKAKADFNTAVGAGGLTFDPTATEEQAGQRKERTYTGPFSMSQQSGWDAVRREGTQAEDAARGGTTGLLRKSYGGRGNWLDAALTQAAGGPQLQGLQAQYADFTRALTLTDQDAAARAKQAAEATTKAAGQYGELHAQRGREAQAAELNTVYDKVNGLIHRLDPTGVTLSTLAPGALRRRVDEVFGPGTWEKYEAARKMRAAGMSPGGGAVGALR